MSMNTLELIAIVRHDVATFSEPSIRNALNAIEAATWLDQTAREAICTWLQNLYVIVTH